MQKIKPTSKKKHLTVTFTVIGIVMALYSLFMMVLLFWGFFTSVKASSGVFNLFRKNEFGLPQGWPWQWQWSNYVVIFDYIYVDVYTNISRTRVNAIGMLINTLIYAFGGAAVATIVPLIAAYATAKVNYKFNVVIDSIVLVCMAIPIVGAQPSELQVLKTLNIYDTWVGHFVQHGHIISIYYLVLQASCRGVPITYSEAAEIEGAGYYSIMFRIVLPLVKTVIMTIFLMQFIACWNNYTYPLVYLKSHPTLAYGVFYLVFINGENIISNEPMRMAGSFILFTPILVLFLIFKDVLMQNLSMGGLKE